MDVQVFKGTVIDVGSTFVAAEINLGTVYTFIEFNNGTMVKMVAMFGSLETKVMASIKAGEPVELHLNHVPKAKNAKYTLVAFRGANDRLYAVDIPPPSMAESVIPILLFGLGFPTIPVMGMGLALWYVAWKLQKNVMSKRALHRYLLTLKADSYIM